MKAPNPNYYQLLHIQVDAPLAIIKASYRALMQTLKQHPDLGGDTEHAALLNQAYNTLSHPQTRAQYDEQLNAIAATPYENNLSQTSCPFCQAPTLIVDTQLCVNCNSPLKSIQDKEYVQLYQRVMERIPKISDVNYYTAWPQTALHGQMHDLSPFGMRIVVSIPVAIDHRIKIDAPFMQATARVSYCQTQTTTTTALGVEFITLLFTHARGNFVSLTA